jgi:chemotaxis protein methyltransferase CheR
MAFTYFFRDLHTLKLACDKALPVLKARRYIKVWDAGCAMGPEAYTLAILLRERMGHMYFRNVRITATDIDESNLFGKIISDGVYPREQVERIPQELLQTYFEKAEQKDAYRVIEEIRRALKFYKHDLLTYKSPGNDFGLIVCKNVLLHFSEAQRINVIKMFYDSLMEGGFLVFEQTQALPQQSAHLFNPVVSNAQVFQKTN